MMINDEHAIVNEKSQGKRRNFDNLIRIIIIILFVLLIAIYLVFNFKLATPDDPNGQCQINLLNIGMALKMYSADNNGHLPNSLKQLTPEYLKELPKCGLAHKDTYSNSYQSNNSNKHEFTFTMNGEKYYKYSMETIAYTIYCSGHYHAEFGVEPNYPHYNSREGLVPR